MQEPIFLLLDTSTEVCSVAIASPGKIIATRQTDSFHAHASLLAVFVKEVLEESGIPLKDFSAVAVSSGPGSYTGLRVGVSTAKGLCYGASLPLISVGSLDMLASLYRQNYPDSEPSTRIVPMIDARRMEVYTAVFDYGCNLLSSVEAKVIDSHSFEDLLKQGPVAFCGDGASKCQSQIVHPNAFFTPIAAHAKGMLEQCTKKWREKQFEDTAYFTPFYLKDFVASVSKNPLSRL